MFLCKLLQHIGRPSMAHQCPMVQWLKITAYWLGKGGNLAFKYSLQNACMEVVLNLFLEFS